MLNAHNGDEPSEKCALIFYTTFVWNISHSDNNWARCDQKCILFLVQSTSSSCTILMKLKFSRRIFEEYSNTKFHGNPSSWSRIFPCGKTDGRTTRYDGASSRSSQFCERERGL